MCAAEYKRGKELHCHVASVHTGVSKYSCPWCPRTFFNNSNLRKHKLKLHLNEVLEEENPKNEGILEDEIIVEEAE